MLKKAVLIVLLSPIIYSSLEAQTVNFNFSLSTQTVSGWINVHGDPSTGVRTGTDGTSGISISSIATGNWAPLSGTGSAYDGLGASGGTFFPSGVMANHWFQYSGTLANYNAAIPQLQISGLNKDSVYTIKMTGSSTSSFGTNPTQYTVAGISVYGYIDINTHNNTALGAVFNNIQPDTNGQIRVYVNTLPTTDVGDICGIQIIRGRTTPAPSVNITNPANNAILPEDGNFGITATASESGGGTISKVEFFIDTSKIGEVTSAPYSVTWINPDEGTYTITATAVDNSGVSNSASINVTIENLSTFWSVTGQAKTNGDTFFIGTVDTNRLSVRTNNIERMTILGDGTVGIGTKSTQGYKLAVNGSAIFTKLRIKAYANWPDFVFSRNYKLPDINQLEKYILLHRHLPGVKTAESAKKEGIDVADQQAELLKKVEELTLYLIAEHKRIDRLSLEVQRLKQENKRLRSPHKVLKR